jgi:atypical dual specificity phosphatase
MSKTLSRNELSCDTGLSPFNAYNTMINLDNYLPLNTSYNKPMPPYEFRWLEKNIIAGSGRIYSISELEWLKHNGVRSIITLRLKPLKKEIIEEFGFDYLFLPMYEIPDLSQIKLFLDFIGLMKVECKPILIHCQHGLGRTGTMHAIYLIDKGLSYEEAIKMVEKNKPTAISNFIQYSVIRSFAEYKKKMMVKIN